MATSTKLSRMGYPNLGYGVGLRNTHLKHILSHGAGVDWFEIISENFMGNYGYARYALDRIREQTPLVMHGVSLSIGSTDPLNMTYLKQLKALATELSPVWISDHLCWTGVSGTNSHDLLPLPLTEEALYHVATRLDIVQDYLGQPVMLENPSTYLEFTHSTLPEWTFLAELTQQTGCGLLLDLNNIYVSSHNHGYDPFDYLKAIPLDKVVQIHLAGPTYHAPYLIDTHDQPVPAIVWQLYARLIELTDGVSTLLEWDSNIPGYPELLKELYKAKMVKDGHIPDHLPLLTLSSSPVSTPLNYQLGGV